MAVNQQINNAAYGLSNALADIFPAPIVSQRAPTTSDFAEIGTVWIDQPANDAFILTNNTGGSSNWTPVGGGPGQFTDLTVTGTSHLEGAVTADAGITVTAGNIAVTAGTVTGGTGLIATTGGLTVSAGGAMVTGTTNINTSGAAATSIGTGTGNVTLGNTTGTMAIRGTSVSFTGAITTNSTVAVGTGLTVTAGNATISAGNLVISGAANYVQTGGGARVYSGTGNPSLSAAKGSIYMKTDATTTTDRLWINTDGSTTWTFFTTGA